jgi:hypothetical protein
MVQCFIFLVAAAALVAFLRENLGGASHKPLPRRRGRADVDDNADPTTSMVKSLGGRDLARATDGEIVMTGSSQPWRREHRARPNASTTPSGAHTSQLALVALALASVDTSARAWIAVHFHESLGEALLQLPVGFVTAYLVFGSAQLARPGALAIAIPMAGLLTIGDIVAASLRMGAQGWHAQLPVLCAALLFIVTAAVVRDRTGLGRAGELLGCCGVILIALPLVPGSRVPLSGQADWVQVGMQAAPTQLGRVLVLLGFAAALSELPAHGRAQLRWRDAEVAAKRALMIPVIAVATHVVQRDLSSALLLTLALAGVLRSRDGQRATGRVGGRPRRPRLRSRGVDRHRRTGWP